MFDTLVDAIYDCYNLIMTTSALLVSWFTSEISAEVATLLSLPSSTTNLEMMLGTFVPVMLTLTLIGAIVKAIIPNG